MIVKQQLKATIKKNTVKKNYTAIKIFQKTKK